MMAAWDGFRNAAMPVNTATAATMICPRQKNLLVLSIIVGDFRRNGWVAAGKRINKTF